MKAYNFALLPDESVTTRALLLSQQLATLDSEFTLDGKNYFPHLTLYMSTFSDRGIFQALQYLTKNLSSLSPINLTAEKFFMNDSHYIDIQYRLTDQLMNTHNYVTNAVKPFRKKLPVTLDQYSSNMEAEAMYHNAVTTGYAIGGSLYRPHITLTKFPAPTPKALESVAWEKLDFVADKLGVFEADSLGCCRKPVELFSLVTLETI